MTSLKRAREVLERGYAGRRTASTDWNERSSRSHSVFRVVVESRERGNGGGGSGSGSTGGGDGDGDGRSTPAVDGRMTPGFRPQTPGGTKLQSRGGRSVQTSVLVSFVSLIMSSRWAHDVRECIDFAEFNRFGGE